MTDAQLRRSRWAPAPHWLLLALLAVAISAGLLLQAFAHNAIGRSSTAIAVPADAQSVAPGTGSIIYQSGDRLLSRGLPARTVALTFDDGPSARWTPLVLAVLARERVPATFFDVGSRAAAEPGLVRAELRAGDEVGSHTFTHALLTGLPGWQVNLELAMTQLSLAAGVRRNTVLLRPPYSSTPDAVTAADLRVIRQATNAGYLVVLADRDSEDWTRPGWERIVHNALPADDSGAVLMFHDAGGDRSQTVQALPHVIDELRARGYRFETVTGAVGLAPAAADQPTRQLTHLQGMALLGALRVSGWLGAFVTWVVLPLGILAVLRTFAMLALARRHRRIASRRVPRTAFLPEVSVVVPAYNEAVGIAAALRSLASSDYPELEIVLVDDGSTDGTAEIAASLGLAAVRVISQPNAGKAAALNTGIAAASNDVVVLVDGDTVFQPDTVRALVQPLRDPLVGAVAGNTKVGNRHGLLGRWQHLEYVVAFNLDRRMFDLLGCITTVPGAVGAFRRELLRELGGVSLDTLAEDTDLTMSILRAGHRVVYEPSAIAWTEAPRNLRDLWRQRYRWCYGTMQAIWKHRRAVFEPGPGRRLGLIGLPSLLAFQVAFPLLSPALDLFGLFGLIALDPRAVALGWFGFLVLQLFTAAYALRLDREPLRTLWALPLQQFVYRQVMYLVVVGSVVSAITGVRLRWHKLHRTGSATYRVEAAGG